MLFTTFVLDTFLLLGTTIGSTAAASLPVARHLDLAASALGDRSSSPPTLGGTCTFHVTWQFNGCGMYECTTSETLTVHIYDIKNKEIPLKWNSHNFNNVQDQTVINDSIDFPTKGGLSYPITIHPLNGGVTAMDFTINAPKPATFQSPTPYTCTQNIDLSNPGAPASKSGPNGLQVKCYDKTHFDMTGAWDC